MVERAAGRTVGRQAARICAWVWAGLIALVARETLAQSNLPPSLTVSANQVNFGNRNELSRDTLGLWVFNQDTATLTCRATCLPYYGSLPFATDDTLFSLAPGQSRRLTLRFTPVHNTLNNSECILTHSGRGGALRIDLSGQGVYSNTYYNSTQNLEGEALRLALAQRLASPYTQLGYSGTNNARLRMFGVVDNWKVNGREPNHANPYKNECVYSGRTISYPTADFSTATLNNAPYSMNTEHTWPQSFMGSAEPMQSDLHHLFVSDGGLNSARGNKPFGWVPNPTLTYSGGSKANSVWFEPREVHKGPVARAILYFALRHASNSQVVTGFLDTAQQRMLREWVRLYPSDSIARKRNNDIQTAQSNRNPLVDYPQLLERMTSVLPTAQSPVFVTYHLSETSVNMGSVAQGQSRVHTLWITNSGNLTLQVSGLQITGQGLVFHPAGTGTLPSFAVPPGESVALQLTHAAGLAPGMTHQGTLSMNLAFPGQAVVSRQVPLQVTVINSAGTGVLQGQLTYDNTAASPVPGVTLRVLDSLQQQVGQAVTDAQGQFQVSGLQPGSYSLVWANSLPWSGVTASDALIANRHIVGSVTLAGVRLRAADANNSGTLTSGDALLLNRRVAGVLSSFGAGDWVYSAYSCTLNPGQSLNLPVKTLCTGDLNASRLF